MMVNSVNFLRGAVEWFLPDGHNLDMEQVVVLAIEVEGNRGGIGKLYGVEFFCETFIEGLVGLPDVYHVT